MKDQPLESETVILRYSEEPGRSWTTARSFSLPPREDHVSPADIVAHPAARASSRLGGRIGKPSRCDALTERGDYAVYRLANAAMDATDVIAMRCRPRRAAIEALIYRRVFPGAPIAPLHYFGTVPESRTAEWVFIEDAAGEAYSPLDCNHRVLAGRWLGALHAWAAGASREFRQITLRDVSAAAMRHRLRRAVKLMQFHRQSDGFPQRMHTHDLAIIDQLIARCQLALSRWDEIQRFCDSMPRTIVHGDFAVQNLRLRSGPDGPRVVAFDWEDAAWGTPALDLMEFDPDLSPDVAGPDLAAYYETVKPHWPDITETDIRRLALIGRVFWYVLAIRMDAVWLGEEWPERRLRDFRLYAAEFADVLRAMKWTD